MTPQQAQALTELRDWMKKWDAFIEIIDPISKTSLELNIGEGGLFEIDSHFLTNENIENQIKEKYGNTNRNVNKSSKIRRLKKYFLKVAKCLLKAM